MKRTIFSEEHDMFRQAFASFVQREIVPYQETWREAGMVSRDVWRAAGEAGFLCPWMEEEHGGAGGDFLHSMVIIEELAKAHENGFAASLHSDIVVPYIHEFGNDEQKKRWLPGLASGDLISAIAMTEPGTGSDLAGIKATAKKDGDEYVINGSKTFISNGQICDLVIVAAKTGGPDDNPHSSVSLFVVEAGTKGFSRGRKLDKVGLHAQDTSELHFEDCRVPASNLLGSAGGGFLMLMKKLQQERIVVAIGCQAAAGKVVEEAVAYCKEREAFGRPITKFQNTQFKLAECATEVEVGQAFLDNLVAAHAKGAYLVKECSMAKLWHSEMLGRVVDECLQLYGGYGYMNEYPIARDYADARVQRIFAGTSEIMKVIIAKQMGL